MATLAALRKRAKDLGLSASDIRSASTTSELESLIADFSGNGNGSKAKAKAKAKKKAATATQRKSTAKRGSARKPQRSKSVPARSQKSGAAKRPTTATKRKATASTANGGRNLLDGVNFSQTDGWNAREGSIPDQIVSLLRKFRGNRTKVFDTMVKSIGDFIPARKRDGSKRTKEERTEMLMYRINRTAWEFAKATGQHEPSGNRVEYGTGGTGEGVWVPADDRPVKKRASAKRSTAKRGATTRKATGKRAAAQRGSQKAAGTRNKKASGSKKRKSSRR